VGPVDSHAANPLFNGRNDTEESVGDLPTQSAPLLEYAFRPSMPNIFR
jgi:hypothetical protein